MRRALPSVLLFVAGCSAAVAATPAKDAPTPFDAVRPNPQGTKKGYDPYDSGRLAKAAAAAKKKDLRRLGEWLKLKKQADGHKKSDGKG